MNEERSRGVRATRIAGGAVLAALVTVAALAVIPGARASVGPASVVARVRAGAGATLLRLPPLGSIEAATHAVPITVTVAVEEVDVETLATLATTANGRAELREQVEHDLQDLARAAALRFLLGGLLIGAIAGLVIFQRRWGGIAAASCAGGAVVALLGVAIGGDYDVRAFEAPRYSGSLSRASAVLETLNQRIEVLDEARSRYAVATRKLSDLFVLMSRAEVDLETNAVAILHVSDIHANPIGLEVTDELAHEFDVDMIIDTGDISSSELDTGEISTLAAPLDAALARGVGRIGVPYVFVPGNHDSPQLRARLARTENVLVLEEEVANVAGVEVLGWADPTFSTTPIPEEIKAERRLETAPDVAAEVEVRRPDILAVHDSRLASESYGDVAVVLAGHTHERDLEEVDGTLVLTVGSTGATGLKSFTVEAERRYEAEVVYMEAGRVVAVDYLSLGDLGADFTVERRTFEPAEM